MHSVKTDYSMESRPVKPGDYAIIRYPADPELKGENEGRIVKVIRYSRAGTCYPSVKGVKFWMPENENPNEWVDVFAASLPLRVYDHKNQRNDYVYERPMRLAHLIAISGRDINLACMQDTNPKTGKIENRKSPMA